MLQIYKTFLIAVNADMIFCSMCKGYTYLNSKKGEKITLSPLSASNRLLAAE